MGSRSSYLHWIIVASYIPLPSSPNFIPMQDGVVATWNLQLRFQHGIQLDGVVVGKTKGAVWVSDFVVMVNCNKIVLSTSSRELIFFDISTQNYKCHYRIHGKIQSRTHTKSVLLTLTSTSAFLVYYCPNDAQLVPNFSSC